MSERPSDSEGIEDEVKVANHFLRLGFFARPHVQVYPSASKRKVSDIDVLAFKFDRYLDRTLVLAEVKKDSDRVSDLFKLYGFKSYFGGADPYFISDRISDAFVDVAKSIGIKAISFSKLKDMSMTVGKEVEEEFSAKDVQATEKLLDLVKERSGPETYWAYHHIWLERNPYVKFFKIRGLFTRTNQSPIDTTTIEVLWFRKELFIQATATLLEMSSDCNTIESTGLKNYVAERFYNVGMPKESKLRVKEGVDSLLSIIKQLAGDSQLPRLPTVEVVPRYLDSLVDLIGLVIRNARFANSYLIQNDLIYRASLHGKQVSVEQLAKSSAQAHSLKLLNDKLLRMMHGGPVQADFNTFV